MPPIKMNRNNVKRRIPFVETLFLRALEPGGIRLLRKSSVAARKGMKRLPSTVKEMTMKVGRA